MKQSNNNDWEQSFVKLKELELEASGKKEVYNQLMQSIERPRGFLHTFNKVIPVLSLIVFFIIGGFLANTLLLNDEDGKGTSQKEEYVFQEKDFPTLKKHELTLTKKEKYWYIENKFGSTVGSLLLTQSAEEFYRRKSINAIQEQKEVVNDPFNYLFMREHIKQPNLVQKLHYYFSHGEDHFHLQIHLGSIGSVFEEDASAILEEFQNQVLMQKGTVENASFRAILSTLINGENRFLAIVNDNRKNEMQIPSEWEAYRLQIEEETEIIDSNGNEISLNDINVYEYYLNVWTKEPFISEWTKLEGNQQESMYENHPLYTAKKIQLVEIPNEDFLERLYSKEEGKYALYVYLGDDLGGESGGKIQKEINTLLHKDKNNMYIVSFISVPPEQEKRIFNIVKYPTYVILDHEKIVINTVELEEVLPYLNE